MSTELSAGLEPLRIVLMTAEGDDMNALALAAKRDESARRFAATEKRVLVGDFRLIAAEALPVGLFAATWEVDTMPID